MCSRASARWRPTTRRWAGSIWTAFPPAPRGVPQIEVTFDIDANGIVNVSAKDLGTGKEQKITITASTNMSKDDVEKAVRDAEQFAEADKKRKEEIEVRNQAEQLVYQSEKSLGEIGDKVSDAEKDAVKAEIEKVKTALSGTDTEQIKSATEELSKKFYELSAKLYQQASAQQQAGADGAAGAAGPQENPDGTVSGDYTVVDDDKKD